MEDLRGIIKQIQDFIDGLKNTEGNTSNLENTAPKNTTETKDISKSRNTPKEDDDSNIDFKDDTEFNIVGVFSDEQNVFLIERDKKGKEYLIPSSDGENFDATERMERSKYTQDYYFYIPVAVENWNHPARDIIKPRDDKFDHANITIIGEVVTKNGLMVFYDTSYITSGYQRLIGGAFVVSKFTEKEIEWRTEDPMWDEFVKNDPIKFKPLGITYFSGKFHVYYYRNNEVYAIKFADPFHKIDVEIARTQIKKYLKNPILEPNPDNHWESMATFNPAAVTFNEKVHLFYRAQGHDHLSVVGYAHSDDGYNFERLQHPVYVPDRAFKKVNCTFGPPDPRRISGDGWGGCEDPRATVIDDKLYLVYVAFDGWSEPRLAMSNISLKDIEEQNWENWSDPVFMTPWSNIWGTGNKSGIIFPEKVNGKFVIMHRIWPNICIDFVDDLEFGKGEKYLNITKQIKVRPGYWDSLKIGAGAPPIEVDEGWLLIYFGVGHRDRSKYKIGAMILDKEDPSKVLYRSSTPIISPDEWYENAGKPGVAYPCGAVVKDGNLIVYYGGADTVVCAATCNLREFVDDLKKDVIESKLLQQVYVHN